VRRRMIFACLHEMMASARVRLKETLGTHVTCSSNRCWCQLAGREKRKGFAYGDESERPAPSQTSKPWHGVGGFPANVVLPPTHGRDSG